MNVWLSFFSGKALRDISRAARKGELVGSGLQPASRSMMEVEIGPRRKRNGEDFRNKYVAILSIFILIRI